MNYQERLLLPENAIADDAALEFKTSDGTVLAKGYIRVVIGGRGPYLECSQEQIQHNHIKEVVSSDPNKFHYYYDEYRSADGSFVKLYKQKRTVDYADYRVGYWYIDPFKLTTDKYRVLIKPLERKKKQKPEEAQINFD